MSQKISYLLTFLQPCHFFIDFFMNSTSIVASRKSQSSLAFCAPFLCPLFVPPFFVLLLIHPALADSIYLNASAFRDIAIGTSHYDEFVTKCFQILDHKEMTTEISVNLVNPSFELALSSPTQTSVSLTHHRIITRIKT